MTTRAFRPFLFALTFAASLGGIAGSASADCYQGPPVCAPGPVVCGYAGCFPGPPVCMPGPVVCAPERSSGRCHYEERTVCDSMTGCRSQQERVCESDRSY